MINVRYWHTDDLNYERKADISVNKMSMVSFCTLIVIKVQLFN